MSLARLVYVSTARPGLAASELDALLTQARTRNEASGLTGLLVYNGVHFMQALEGPRETLEGVYSSISADTRHHGLVSLYEEDIAERAFPGWSMAFSVIAGQEAAEDTLRVPANRVRDLVPAAAGAELAMLFTSFNTLDRLGAG